MATGSSAPTSSITAATRRWAAPGLTWTSPRSVGRRSGRTRPRATPRPRPTPGGGGTTRTAPSRHRGSWPGPPRPPEAIMKDEPPNVRRTAAPSRSPPPGPDAGSAAAWLGPAVGDRQAAIAAEVARGDLRAGRVLAPLVLGVIHHRDHPVPQGGVGPGGDELRRTHVLHPVVLETRLPPPGGRQPCG